MKAEAKALNELDKDVLNQIRFLPLLVIRMPLMTRVIRGRVELRFPSLSLSLLRPRPRVLRPRAPRNIYFHRFTDKKRLAIELLG